MAGAIHPLLAHGWERGGQGKCVVDPYQTRSALPWSSSCHSYILIITCALVKHEVRCDSGVHTVRAVFGVPSLYSGEDAIRAWVLPLIPRRFKLPQGPTVSTKLIQFHSPRENEYL
jgi:hypothetical protein